MKSDFNLFWLSQIKGLGSHSIGEIIKQKNNDLTDLNNVCDLSAKYQNIISRNLADKNFTNQVTRKYNDLDKNKINILSPLYPDSLKNIYDPPLFLFYRGNIKLLNNQNVLTVVGSRTLSSYHQQSTIHIIEQLIGSPIVIASGLAVGIDSVAHRSALKNNLPTIAVLGSGLDNENIYPKLNIKLAEEILSRDGLLTSEYPTGTKAALHHFPKRNRILAGLCKCLVVISGATKSGTLITAQIAIDEGREVYALPGNINLQLSLGPNKLIQNGAHIIYSADDILTCYNITNKFEAKKINFKNEIHVKIYSALQNEPLTVRQLSQQLTLIPEEINISLSEMELLGILKTNKQNQIELL